MSLGIITHFKINEGLQNNNNVIPFKGKETLPKVKVPTSPTQDPVNLPGVPLNQAKTFIEVANEMGVSIGDFFALNMKHLLTKIEGVEAEPSVTVNVGRTKVTSLIDAKQIFEKTVEYIDSAKNSIQIEMFEMQNLDVDSDLWPSGGAERIPGWKEQQAILHKLIEKKKNDPKLNVQVILDVHKWYQDGAGNYKRHYGNMKMIKYLKENGIDVVPYPRPAQGGAGLQHVKMLAVDGKKVILGGMNWGNHSAANHDACVAIETQSKYKNSEVDNIVDKIFNQDWKFAWQRLGKTQFVNGPVTKEEQKEYSGRAKKIKEENVEYMNIVGKIFDKPEYRERYEKGDLNIVEVNPVKDPKIQVLVNNPREYAYVGSQGEESIGEYIKQRLDTAESLKAELFVLSHKEIVNKIISRYLESQNGGRPFDVEILISPGIIDDFPYCRKAISQLEEAGVPIRMFKVNKDIAQRLHTKWAVFDNEELLIGSANWSAVGLESNIETGQRNDYPLTNALLDKKIGEKRDRIQELEKKVGLPTIYTSPNKINFDLLKERRRLLKSDIEKLDLNDMDNLELMNEQHLVSFKKLLGYYNLLKTLEDRKEKYKRGNHECAVVVPNKELAATFLRQFDKDWVHSTPTVPDGYDVDDVDDDDEDELKGEQLIPFNGRKITQFIKPENPAFNKVV
jgi:phosphatidylserine/phosphatidylglycerophosphate/cardiolipin synthase-like enzyme